MFCAAILKIKNTIKYVNFRGVWSGGNFQSWLAAQKIAGRGTDHMSFGAVEILLLMVSLKKHSLIELLFARLGFTMSACVA